MENTHKEFTRTQRQIAKAEHEALREHNPKTHNEGKAKLLVKIVDIYSNTKYPTYECRLK